jgi:hypothetical protein
MAARVQTRSPGTALELQSDSKTLLYEFQLFCGTAAQLSLTPSPYNTTVQNALVESFAIHCRALIAFFFAHDKDNEAGNVLPTDVLAAYFFPDDAPWANFCPRIIAQMKNAKRQADKEIAHITTDRRDVNQPGGKESRWAISDIHAELRTVMKAFLHNAPETLFASGVRAYLNTLAESGEPPTVIPTPGNSFPDLYSPICMHAKTAASKDGKEDGKDRRGQ